MKGKLFVIVAPSGTGKSTIAKRLLKENSNLTESVSFTTRPVRPGEVDGVDYWFISISEFERKKERQEFLEWAQVHGNFYGTSKAFVESALLKGQNILLDLDIQGADALKKVFKGGESSVLTIFIAPPSIEELKRRLTARGTEGTETIERRVMNARDEILRKEDYDYCVLNEDLNVAYQEIQQIFDEALK